MLNYSIKTDQISEGEVLISETKNQGIKNAPISPQIRFGKSLESKFAPHLMKLKFKHPPPLISHLLTKSIH
jgi:hypothetical protein